MSSDSDSGAANRPGNVGSTKWFTEIIAAVNKPLSYFVLATLALIVMFTMDQENRLYILGLVCILILVITYLTVSHPGSLMGEPAPAKRGPEQEAWPVPEEEPGTPESVTALSDPQQPPSNTPDVIRERIMQLNADIYGTDARPPNLDCWYKELQPTLHQAPFYTVPTYFLDRDLYILDYNPAFELIFSGAAPYLRGRHVIWFIAQLKNHQQVHDHGREFTERVVRENAFPLIDLEPIVYDSPEFGRVEFTKIASQLHDRDGKLQGWAVALMIRQIAWEPFEKKLGEKLRQDKLWSVYSASYDRLLPGFPPYRQLIADVIDVLPGSDLLVADLGAGTGNVTAALLEKGHRVVAIENNVGMLDRFRAKNLPSGSVTIIKDSIEDCERLKEATFDGVVLVNVLYAVGDPVACLRQIHRLLKPGAVLAFSTTHRQTRLDELLEAIKTHLEQAGTYPRLANDYLSLSKLNREIERSIARRYTREEYLGFVAMAGFEVTRHLPSTYHNAVMLVHARKK